MNDKVLKTRFGFEEFEEQNSKKIKYPAMLIDIQSFGQSEKFLDIK